jgi:hypothetical protein
MKFVSDPSLNVALPTTCPESLMPQRLVDTAFG